VAHHSVIPEAEGEKCAGASGPTGKAADFARKYDITLEKIHKDANSPYID